ncbi:hypothetical protein [Jiangella asiatica]|uniref:Tripartite tricarboxylate transporter TctB family protein n=1 Tax=Jiangella asiatica TaxID=2530372 RepID=A0A4R5CPH4_9ACTN|nr:hypothetical protein [Jiangella asiatica]TDE00681.1 hypothetical protein E1269_24785 [Jiangella asiatica]
MSEPARAARGSTRDRRREPHRITFDLLLAAFLATFVYSSLDLRPDSRLVPLIVGLPTLAAMLVRTVLDLRGTNPERGRAASRPDGLATASLADLTRAAREEVAADAELATGGQELRRQRVFALWGLAVVMVPVLATEYLQPIPGLRTYFVPAVVAGLLFIIRWVGMSWVKTVAITASISALMYLLLGVLLNVRL